MESGVRKGHSSVHEWSADRAPTTAGWFDVTHRAAGTALTQPPTDADPAFLLASLAASNVGTWEYDVVQDRMRGCSVMAALYGLSPEEGMHGVPISRITRATHPDDRKLSQAKRAQMLQRGGSFVLEYRVMTSPYEIRWILLRGFYERDAAGRVVRGRGIAVDLTEGKQAGLAEGDVFFVTEADDRTVGALDRATRHVLAARRALDELDPGDAARLQRAADALLLEIAQHIAGTLIPVTPTRTEH